LDFRNPRLVNEFHAHILLAAAELRGIDGYEETFHTTLLSMLNILPCDLPVTINVELQELDLTGDRGVNDLIECARCERWDLCIADQQ
jgi:hypothetical protein